MVLSQREAVYKVTTEALVSAGIVFTPKVTVVRSVVNSIIRSQIIETLCIMFKNSEVELKATEANAKKLSDTSELRSYVGGLVTNWFNKDPNLNGGTKYETKNPGSKPASSKPAKSSNPAVTDLNKLKKTLVDTGASVEAIKAIDEQISSVLNPKTEEELAAEALPMELRELFDL